MSYNKRLPYIDIAKGVLIWMVIIGHVYYFLCRKRFDPTFSLISPICSFLWVPYNMPAFFIITGICSNFEKDFLTFFKSNFKTLKIPAITLTAIWLLVRKICSGETDPISYLHLGLVNSWISSDYWFLDALFLTKMTYWLIHKFIKKETMRFFICLLFYCAGFYLTNYTEIREIGAYKHAMLLMIFLYIGTYIKKFEISKTITFICLGLYIAFSFFNQLVGIGQPDISGGIKLTNINFILCLFQATLGSIGIIGLCKIWGENRFFEYCGRKSLIFYCVHIMCLFEIKEFFIDYMPQENIILSVLTHIAILLFVFIVCSGAAWLFDTKYGKYIVGKF